MQQSILFERRGVGAKEPVVEMHEQRPCLPPVRRTERTKNPLGKPIEDARDSLVWLWHLESR